MESTVSIGPDIDKATAYVGATWTFQAKIKILIIN